MSTFQSVLRIVLVDDRSLSTWEFLLRTLLAVAISQSVFRSEDQERPIGLSTSAYLLRAYLLRAVMVSVWIGLEGGTIGQIVSVIVVTPVAGWWCDLDYWWTDLNTLKERFLSW